MPRTATGKSPSFRFSTHSILQLTIQAEIVYSPSFGENPHISNSGEIVYAEWFGGPAWDLVSSTRGRLTYGSIIDINESDFDVNASGKVVYATRDTNNTLQVYSTVRGQLTFSEGI